ncbi:MAG: hypothetical protein R3E86_01520 [Pseudomonadales bacterium]
MQGPDILQTFPLPPRARERAAALARAGRGPEDWRWLAAALALYLEPRLNSGPGPLVVGIGGGQGAGKSTLARLLVEALCALGRRAATASIDDFYLTRAGRLALAASVHPLLATRGVPGTHDLALLQTTLDALAREGTVRLPRFDKGADDRSPSAAWPEVEAPLEVFVLEGWCLGAQAAPAARLREPINALEAEEDRDGAWRRYVNAALAGPYAELWQRVDFWVFLAVPDLAAVRRWRAEQEQALPPPQRMGDAALARFIAHYQRITEQMLGRWARADSPADLLVTLDESHRAVALQLRAAH